MSRDTLDRKAEAMQVPDTMKAAEVAGPPAGMIAGRIPEAAELAAVHPEVVQPAVNNPAAAVVPVMAVVVRQRVDCLAVGLDPFDTI